MSEDKPMLDFRPVESQAGYVGVRVAMGGGASIERVMHWTDAIAELQIMASAIQTAREKDSSGA